MKISVCGTGYVGLTVGACFAEMGNHVTCVDIDTQKIHHLRQGICPFYEPKLSDILKRNIQANRLHFTDNLGDAVDNTDVIFIAVGTPPQPDGSLDIKNILEISKYIGEHIKGYRAIVIKSTVPVGTAQQVRALIQSCLEARQVNVTFDVVSNPEFLTEGTAVDDCLKPSRVVIGCYSTQAQDLMRVLYESFLKSGHPLLFMNTASAELTKYAANAMLATKVSFINELSRVCERVGAHVEKIRLGIGLDPRIGPHFLYAGLGYGGSCLPKDLRALIKLGQDYDEDLRILRAVDQTNDLQRERFYNRMAWHFSGDFRHRKIALWGLAFKPETDDMREAPSLYLIEKLMRAGAQMTAFDPVAMPHAQQACAHIPSLRFVDDPYEAVRGADALCIVTEWKQFRGPCFEKLRDLMRCFVIFDGRNMYNVAHIPPAAAACTYYNMGQGKSRDTFRD